MGTPTRFPNGVTNVAANADMRRLPLLDPTVQHVIFDDMAPYVAADYTVTSVGAGSTAAADGKGGIITITTGALENDGDFLEHVTETFLLTAKKAWLKGRFRISAAAESDFVFGLHSTSTTPQAAAHRFLFESVDGSAACYFNVDNNTTDTDSGTVHTIVDATWFTLAAYWDGVSKVELYADGVKTGQMTDVTPSTTELALGFGLLTGAAAAITMDVDYVLAVQDR